MIRWRERRSNARPAELDLRNLMIRSLTTLYNIRVENAKSARGAAARQAWTEARATIARIGPLQEEVVRDGAATAAGPDRAALAREIAQCDAALAKLSQAP